MSIRKGDTLIVANIQKSNFPIGGVAMYIGSTPPDGWLICNGATFDQATYPKLYSLLGSNTLPDMRECTPVGAGRNTTYSIADHDEYSVGQFKDDQLQEHQHNFINWSFTNMRASGNSVQYAQSYTGSTTTGNTGRTGTTTHGKQFGVNFIIRAA